MVNSICPCDIANALTSVPKQPMISFPSRSFGKCKRAFNPAWYKRFPWLEYSITNDAVYCFPCRFFRSAQAHRSDNAFVSTGFRNWKNALGKQGTIVCHDTCESHKVAMVSWQDYRRNTELGTTVIDRLDSTHNKLIQENRHYIQTLAQVLLYCAKQCLPLRGHNESVNTSHNLGNYLELLSLIAQYDPIVKHRISSGPNNTVLRFKMIC